MSFAFLMLKESRELSKDHLNGKIPALPQRMGVSFGKLWRRNWMAFMSPHNTFGEKEISKQGCNHEVLSEEFLEKRSRKSIPSNCIRNCGKYPIQFAKRTPSVLETPRYSEIVNGYIGVQRILQNKISQRNLDRGS
ncbi:predicted protein [Histoplasma capsulatum G186AR]|uniref:Uncharacterized protein n=1 Tax=Ajellomyces capsulatus (strain G186AR / H82 / ATCC MYA-2454 / RMSCC 2432) TaxID=447093 RepID=C0NGX4_AJECG|nr:uncharacterized protein HCBG_02596 [Histoplasma capsulatum G186AR]EEH09059.1 predicted protein [Histoplasma capsulatum G186AR]